MKTAKTKQLQVAPLPAAPKPDEYFSRLAEEARRAEARLRRGRWEDRLRLQAYSEARCRRHQWRCVAAVGLCVVTVFGAVVMQPGTVASALLGVLAAAGWVAGAMQFASARSWRAKADLAARPRKRERKSIHALTSPLSQLPEIGVEEALAAQLRAQTKDN